MEKEYINRILQSALALLVLSAILTCPATAITTITDDISLPQQLYVQGEIFVKYPDAANGIAVLPGINTNTPAEILTDYGSLVPGLMLVKVPDGVTVEDAVAYYNSLPEVEYVHPNYYVSSCAIPNDPDYSSYQWGLKNPSSQGGISAPEAWDIAIGNDSVIVAVLDSGVDIEHPDLAANIWTNPGETPNDGIDNDGNGYVDDYHGWNVNSDTPDVMDYNGHGTHCAGIIGAVTNNGQGIAGVAWNVSIMPVSVFDCDFHRSADEVIRGIQYAVVNHADILSMSFGNPTYCQAEKDAIDAAGVNGILCVCSAGNDGTNNDADSPKYPSSYDSPNILAVAASDANNTLTDFSNYGLISVDIAAPGNEIYSTYPILSGVPLNITSFTTMGVLGDTWEYGVFEGQNYTCIRGNASSLLYYMEPVSVSGHSFTIGDTVAYNLSSDSYLAYVFSNKNYSQYASLAEFENDEYNVFYLYFYLDSDTKGVFYTSSDTRLRTLIEYILGPGPYYIGMYYTSTADSDYVNLTSLVFVNNDRVTGHTYENMSGTSMSAPMVAGAAAVMKAVNQSLTPEQIIDSIIETADTYDSMQGKIRSGGRLNFTRALMNIRPEFKVRFDTDGGSVVPLQSVIYGESALRPAEDPALAGYTFADWYADEACTTLWNFTNRIYENTVIYANWTVYSKENSTVSGVATFNDDANVVKIVAIQNTTTDVSKVNITYEPSAAAPSSDSSYKRKALTPVFNITLTGNLGSDTVKIVFNMTTDELDGASPANIYLVHKKNGAWEYFKPSYTQTGDVYTFTVTGVTSFSPFVPISMTAVPQQLPSGGSSHQGGSILLAESTNNSFCNVNFIMNGHGVQIVNLSVGYGSTIAESSPVPNAEGFVFEGWYSDAGLSAKYVFSTPVTSDIYLYAKWTAVQLPTPTPKTPAPFIGLIAGLGAAALVLRLKK